MADMLTELDRAIRRAKADRADRPNGCGTVAGHQAHIDRGETPCRDCCDARAVYQRIWRRKQVFDVPAVQELLERRPELADMTAAGVYVAAEWGAA